MSKRYTCERCGHVQGTKYCGRVVRERTSYFGVIQEVCGLIVGHQGECLVVRNPNFA